MLVKRFLNSEQWRAVSSIPGLEEYEGYYVSRLGNVLSLKGGRHGTGEPKILKASVDKDGYLRVYLCSNGKIKTMFVHRLVSLAFIPNPCNLPIINHMDENKKNNTVDNLEFCTHAYNNNYGSRFKRKKVDIFAKYGFKK